MSPGRRTVRAKGCGLAAQAQRHLLVKAAQIHVHLLYQQAPSPLLRCPATPCASVTPCVYAVALPHVPKMAMMLCIKGYRVHLLSSALNGEVRMRCPSCW